MNPVNHLLIIDDDHALVNLLKRFLRQRAFTSTLPMTMIPVWLPLSSVITS